MVIYVEERTNGRFIEILLGADASKDVDAKGILSDFPAFRAWMKLPATSESVEAIAEVFSARVYESLKSLRGFDDLYQAKIDSINAFLDYLRQLAKRIFGITVDLSEASEILCQP